MIAVGSQNQADQDELKCLSCGHTFSCQRTRVQGNPCNIILGLWADGTPLWKDSHDSIGVSTSFEVYLSIRGDSIITCVLSKSCSHCSFFSVST